MSMRRNGVAQGGARTSAKNELHVLRDRFAHLLRDVPSYRLRFFPKSTEPDLDDCKPILDWHLMPVTVGSVRGGEFRLKTVTLIKLDTADE